MSSQQLVLPLQFTKLQGRLNTGNEPTPFNRLDYVIKGSSSHTLDRGFDIVRTGNDDDGNMGKITGNLRKELFTRKVRHPQVQQHDFDVLLCQQ